jgi:hypothetical protein
VKKVEQRNSKAAGGGQEIDMVRKDTKLPIFLEEVWIGLRENR